MEHLKCSSDWDREFDKNKWLSGPERSHGPLVLLSPQSQALLCYLCWFVCNKQQKKPRTFWQESCETCPITSYGFVFPGKFSINGYHFLLKMPVPFTSVRHCLYCSSVIKQWTFLSYLETADLPWLVHFRKTYLVEFLLGRKR